MTSLHLIGRRSLPRALLLSVALVTTTLAQETIIIDVPKARAKASGTSDVVHYRGDWSVRQSEQRSYSGASARRSVSAAEGRTAGTTGERRSESASDRRTGTAGERTSGGASERHGSVHLDTVR